MPGGTTSSSCSRTRLTLPLTQQDAAHASPHAGGLQTYRPDISEKHEGIKSDIINVKLCAGVGRRCVSGASRRAVVLLLFVIIYSHKKHQVLLCSSPTPKEEPRLDSTRDTEHRGRPS